MVWVCYNCCEVWMNGISVHVVCSVDKTQTLIVGHAYCVFGGSQCARIILL